MAYLRSFPGGSYGKKSPWNAGDPDLIPEWGKFLGEGNGHTLQYSCLENSMDIWAWWAMGSKRVGQDWKIFTFTFIHTECMNKLSKVIIKQSLSWSHNQIAVPLRSPFLRRYFYQLAPLAHEYYLQEVYCWKDSRGRKA